MAKSATARLHAKKDKKIVVLGKDFAGSKAGQTMWVGKPQMMDAYSRASMLQ
ncbi:MAG: hypothetical protein AAF529_22720 [Pseudomonadota bacterium]